MNAPSHRVFGSRRVFRQAQRGRAAVMRIAATAMAASADIAARGVLVAVEVPECRLAFGEHLRLVGSSAELGAWDAGSGLMLDWSEGDNWGAEVALPPGQHSFKLVIVRGDGSQVWEDGDNRSFEVAEGASAAGPALRLTCRYGSTSETAVAQLAAAPAEVSVAEAAGDSSTSDGAADNALALEAEDISAADAALKVEAVSSEPAPLNDTPLAAKDDGAAGAGADSKAASTAGSSNGTAARDARELAEAWRQSKSQRVAAAAKAQADQLPAGAATASATASSDEASYALPFLLSLTAGVVLVVGIAALNGLPDSELPSSLSGLSDLGKGSGQVLAAFQASSSDVLANLKANTASLQQSLAGGLSAAQPSGGSGASGAAFSLQRALAAINLQALNFVSLYK